MIKRERDVITKRTKRYQFLASLHGDKKSVMSLQSCLVSSCSDRTFSFSCVVKGGKKAYVTVAVIITFYIICTTHTYSDTLTHTVVPPTHTHTHSLTHTQYSPHTLVWLARPNPLSCFVMVRFMVKLQHAKQERGMGLASHTTHTHTHTHVHTKPPSPHPHTQYHTPTLHTT